MIFVNTVINYLILITSERLLKLKARAWRIITAAFVGALFSLLIFIDLRGFLFSLLIKLVSTLAVSLIAFRFGSLKEFLKNTLMTLAVSFVYSGAMICIYLLFKPPNMLIINDFVYFEINPLVMIVITAVIYALVYVYEKLLGERMKSTVVKLVFFADGKEYSCIAKLDTGCSLKEPFSSSPVIVADKSVILIGENMNRRVVPYSAVGISSILFAVKADSVTIDGRAVEKEVYIAEGDIRGDNYKAIINPDIIR